MCIRNWKIEEVDLDIWLYFPEIVYMKVLQKKSNM